MGHSGFSRKLDPVGTGLVTSLARPGGNITGLSIQQTDLASKRLETLRELLPGLRTLAILVDTGASNSVLERDETQTAAHTLSLATVTSEVQKVEDIGPPSTGSRAGRKHFMFAPHHF